MKMLEPLKLKHTTIRNRVLMGSMHTGLEEAKNAYDKMAAFYAARAKGGVGLIVTGGYSPNFAGRVQALSSQLSFPWQIKNHKKVTSAVHQHGAKICLQILHAGRYAYHPIPVAPSSLKAPISPFRPIKLTKFMIKKTIWDYANCAALAQKAGYDGVEIMGSEGYLINQFIAPKTNKRKDSYGGSFENRIRFALEVVKAVRKKVSKDFIIIFRLSMLDLVEDGSSWEEVVQLGKELEKLGVDIINTGIGWHEARVPTIATMVPRAAFSWVTEKIRSELTLPLIATNRINTPEVAEEILQKNIADMVSMARPFLADPDFVNKTANKQSHLINTCIACNQACLDHIFEMKVCSCLVNPKACHETEYSMQKTAHPQKIAVVGAGPAGISFAIEAHTKGHHVTLFEKSSVIGGQFNIAKEIPGKEEFHETIRYFKEKLKDIDVKMNTKVTYDMLKDSDFDHIVFSTGVKPRIPNIEGIDHPKVINYQDFILNKVSISKKIAIIGAGGIGFDVAEYILGHHQNFYAEWGVDKEYKNRGGVTNKEAFHTNKKIYLLQRKKSKPGKNLGKTTGWIHRQSLKDKGVIHLVGVSYQKIDDQGLHILLNGEHTILDVDHIILCAGQVSENEVYKKLEASNKNVHLIGGALKASEVDAKRAIKEGVDLAHALS